MGYMNLLESATDGVSRGLLLYFLWTSVLLWAQQARLFGKMSARVRGCLQHCSSGFQLSLGKVTLNFSCAQTVLIFCLLAEKTQDGFLFRNLRPNEKLNLCKHLSLAHTYMIKCYPF